MISRMKKKLFASGVCLLLFAPCFAAEAGLGHDHDMELGLSLSAVKISHAEALLAGLHLHVSRRLAAAGLGSVLSAIVGVETLLGGDPHTALHAGILIHPWRGLALDISPGILWAREDGARETRFVLHLEAAYGFELGELEIGPVVELAFAGKDRHFSVGLHLGYGFS